MQGRFVGFILEKIARCDMAKEEIRDVLSMSKKDQKKWLKETESIVEDLKGGADKGINSRLDSIDSELSSVNFTLTEIHDILKKILVVQKRSTNPR